jgi:hypothetical protein
MKPYNVEIAKTGLRSWKWFLWDKRDRRIFAWGRRYSTRRAAKKGFERVWQRLRKKPIISVKNK